VRHGIKPVIGAVAVTALLAGCSPAGLSGQTDPATTRGAAKSHRPAHPNAGLRSGTELKAFLPRAHDLPPGFKVNVPLVRDSQDVFAPPSTAPAARRAACRRLAGTAWIEAAGVGAASFAQTGFRDSYGEEIDAEIDTFRGNEAALVMARLRKVFAACSAFNMTTSGLHTVVKAATKAGPAVGDESVKAILTAAVWQGGETLAAIRVGNTVVSVNDSTSKSDLGAAAARIAARIARRL
jgi:hypothetical protein